MMSQSARYYVPEPSTWPITGSIALLCMASGAASWFNGWSAGASSWCSPGCCILAYMIVGWFSTVAHESESGKYNKQVDVSFRWGMSWFIFSEVMFFARVLRRALLHAGALGARAGRLEAKLIWPGLQAGLAGRGPGHHGTVHADGRDGASRRSTR